MRRADSYPAPAELRILNGTRPGPNVERRAFRLEEAAESLGVSLDFFREHIAPDLKVIRKGRVRLVPTKEIDRWIEEAASRALD